MSRLLTILTITIFLNLLINLRANSITICEGHLMLTSKIIPEISSPKVRDILRKKKTLNKRATETQNKLSRTKDRMITLENELIYLIFKNTRSITEISEEEVNSFINIIKKTVPDIINPNIFETEFQKILLFFDHQTKKEAVKMAYYSFLENGCIIQFFGEINSIVTTDRPRIKILEIFKEMILKLEQPNTPLANALNLNRSKDATNNLSQIVGKITSAQAETVQSLKDFDQIQEEQKLLQQKLQTLQRPDPLNDIITYGINEIAASFGTHITNSDIEKISRIVKEMSIKVLNEAEIRVLLKKIKKKKIRYQQHSSHISTQIEELVEGIIRSRLNK